MAGEHRRHAPPKPVTHTPLPACAPAHPPQSRDAVMNKVKNRPQALFARNGRWGCWAGWRPVLGMA